MAQQVKNLPACRRHRLDFWVWEDPLEEGTAIAFFSQDCSTTNGFKCFLCFGLRNLSYRIHSSVPNECGRTLGDGERQGGLVCCSPWGRKESDTTG